MPMNLPPEWGKTKWPFQTSSILIILNLDTEKLLICHSADIYKVPSMCQRRARILWLQVTETQFIQLKKRMKMCLKDPGFSSRATKPQKRQGHSRPQELLEPGTSHGGDSLSTFSVHLLQTACFHVVESLRADKKYLLRFVPYSLWPL